MLNIVIPMAGRGSRFTQAGYTMPKPLIPIHENKTMIELVISNLRPAREHRFIFLCLRQHIEEYQIDQKLEKILPSCQILKVNTVTEGAACTVLLAKALVCNNDPLMIANCDQWIDFDINEYLLAMDRDQADGFIMTMTANDPKWSFIHFSGSGKITEVVEKEPVSDEATVGIYNFKRGKDFVQATEIMIEKNLRVKNEFYVAPVFNQMIEKEMKIGYLNIGSEFNGMYGLGIPTDLAKFEKHSISEKALKFCD